ncbi:TRAP transporter large permease [Thalassorhabdomicrobium marinisediminis]|uniref:TRAP transporter large permease n=1 Tax=Thalassorhabdomicrobium marinisediminis TaxID=2170577 RepID=UPI002491F5EA|nr:TRAP transporter large permease [Thalassorhabdomicrobium marinisediminis]
MENEVIGLIGVAALMLMIVLHVPIGVSMAVAGTVTFAFLRNWDAAFSVIGTEATTAIASTDLALIPLFILMGNFAAGGGMARDVYRLAFAFVGHMRGGLAMATIGGCAGFGAVSGSSIATVTTMTKVAYPEMTQRGYSDRVAGGSIAAGGTLGMLVPPSIIFVLYGVLTENFVLTLFAAAIVPATLAVVMHFIAIQVYLRLYPDSGRPAERTDWAGRLKALRGAWSVLLLAIVVAGGIYSGIFTVTESAAVGAVLAMAIAILRGELTLRAFWAALHDTAATTAMIYVIVIGAGVFSYAMTLSLLPETLVNWIGSLPVSPLVIIGILMIFYIIMGAIFDTISAMVLTLPFVYPVILQLGYDPIWWGVIMIMVIEIGMITPPIGINVLVMNAMLPKVSLGTIYRGIVPFLAADLVRLVILILIPALSLWLPTLMDMPR